MVVVNRKSILLDLRMLINITSQINFCLEWMCWMQGFVLATHILQEGKLLVIWIS